MSMAREEAQEILNEVLSRDEFNYRSGKTVRLEWLERIFRDISSFLRRISEEIAKLFDKFVEFVSKILPKGKGGNLILSGEAIRVLVIVLISVLAAALVFLIVVIIIKAVRRNDLLRLDADGDFAQELEAFANDADAPYRLALQKKAEKDFRGAFRYLFISLLIRFRVHGIIEIHKSKTNRRYLSEIRQRDDAVYEKSRGFFDAFNLYWYGRRVLSEEMLETWFVRYDDAVRTAEETEARGPGNENGSGTGAKGSGRKTEKGRKKGAGA